MNTVTKNRGPDDTGIFIDDNVSLGHTRLSIIDLSLNGHQPMSNEDGTILITYNGEIYNFQELRDVLMENGHIFKSNTDTEVIIHAYEEYGLDFINKFNGMWAFCIYDKNKGELILGRDQFGIKPLYYYVDNQRIIFSSMISAILCHKVDTAPNDKTIMEFLAYNLEDNNTSTFFKNINSLARDSLLIYNLNSKQYILKKWYALGSNGKAGNIKDLFSNSVKARMMSDVPIGSCLSGGLDSSSIVCILDKYMNNNFYTFSFIAPGSPIDESKYIKEIGKYTKTTQFFTEMTPKQFIEDINDFVLAQEEPVIGLSAYAQYKVMELAHKHGIKVLLDGQGADELFAGYDYYFCYYFYELFIKLKWLSLFQEILSYVKVNKSLYALKMFAFILMPEPVKYVLWKNFVNPWINHEFLKEMSPNTHDPRWNRMDLKTSLSLTLFNTAIPHLLRWEDKNSMRWSVETRPPFLDSSLVESSLSIDSNKKIHNGLCKIIFRDSVNDILPKLIINRTDKIGFAAPVDNFIREEMINSFFKNIIYSESFKNRPYWQWHKVEKIFNDHLDRKINAGDVIFRFINIELWMRAFFSN